MSVDSWYFSCARTSHTTPEMPCTAVVSTAIANAPPHFLEIELIYLSNYLILYYSLKSIKIEFVRSHRSGAQSRASSCVARARMCASPSPPPPPSFSSIRFRRIMNWARHCVDDDECLFVFGRNKLFHPPPPNRKVVLVASKRGTNNNKNICINKGST